MCFGFGVPVYQIKTGLTAFFPLSLGMSSPDWAMASRLTTGNAMMDAYTQNQARLARAQKLLDAARPLVGVRSEKTRLDRLRALAWRMSRRRRQACGVAFR